MSASEGRAMTAEPALDLRDLLALVRRHWRLVGGTDRSPQRAADMANAYLESLDRFNVEKRNTTAHRTRVFLQTRTAETDSLLRAAEEALRRYQEQHRTVAPASAGSADMQAAT